MRSQIFKSFDGSEPAFGFDGGCAALAGGRDRLAIDVIGDVAGCEDAGDIRGRAAPLDQVSVFVGIERTAERCGVRFVPDGDEHAFQGELGLRSVDQVAKADAVDLTRGIPDVIGDDGIPDRFDFGIGQGAIGHDFRCTQRVAAVDEINFGGKAREKCGLFACRVPSPDDADRHIAVEGAIAGCAGCQATADELVLAFDPEVTGRGTAGDDQRAGLQPFSINLDPVWLPGLELLDHAVAVAGSESFGLLVHALDQFRAVDPLREAGEIFHGRRCGQLSARQATFENEGREIGAGGVDGRRQAGASRAHNDHMFHTGGSKHDQRQRTKGIHAHRPDPPVGPNSEMEGPPFQRSLCMKRLFAAVMLIATGSAGWSQPAEREGEPNPTRDAGEPAMVAPPGSGPEPGWITRPRSVGVGNEGLGNATGATSGTGIVDDRTGSAVTGEIPNALVDPAEAVGTGGGRTDATGTDPDADSGVGSISDSTAAGASPTGMDTPAPAAAPDLEEPTEPAPR